MAIASNWEDLSGINSNWEGLLDPIDANLRRCLVHYGERVGAVGDALDVETKQCRFPPELLFTNTGLQNGNPFIYWVTDYIYTTSAAKETAFAGYVAVASDEGKLVLGRRDILICWRGTIFTAEGIQNLDIHLTSASEVFPGTTAKVHEGFFNLYVTKSSDPNHNETSARDQALDAVRRLVDEYANEEVSITVAGHSLGAAHATLNSMDIVFNGYNKPTGSSSSSAFPVTAFVYASPQVGDENFVNLFEELTSQLHLLRIRNHLDIVPDLPGELLGYRHVGEQLDIITDDLPYTKPQALKHHDLNLLLCGIATYQEETVIGFDIALLNKNNDLLKDEYKVPPNWWTVKEEMVQLDSGIWKPK